MASAAKGEPDEKQSGGLFLACERHTARTPAMQQALSNAWLKAQGLVSVKDLWSKAQGYTGVGERKTSSSEPTWLFRPLRTRMVGGVGVGARNPRLADWASRATDAS